MPIIETKYFGPMSYEEQSCFKFEFGLPAFEDERRFLPLQMPDHKPLVFLQSVETPSLCFVALPVLVADPHYELAVTVEDLEALGLATDRQPRIGTEALVLTLLSIHDDRPATANLLAPIVVNLANRRAVQAIRCDQAHSHEQPILAHRRDGAC
jgi:flagellar assembly factor FliW